MICLPIRTRVNVRSAQAMGVTTRFKTQAIVPSPANENADVATPTNTKKADAPTRKDATEITNN